MNPTDLMKQSQSDHTSESMGVTESIIYKQNGRDDLPLLAFVSNAEVNSKDRKTRVTETVFSSVLLSFEPNVYDVVEHDGLKYAVIKWEKQLGRYMIFTEKDRHHTGKRYKQNVNY